MWEISRWNIVGMCELDGDMIVKTTAPQDGALMERMIVEGEKGGT